MNLFNNNNRKELSNEDGLWITENNLFVFSEVPPISADEHDSVIEDSGHTFTNGQIHDRSINKRFVREFKKWVDRYERIIRDVEWEFENEENVDDRIKLICATLFTFHRYRNKFLLNTFLKCAEYVGENFAYEARSIHYNTKKKLKGIYGKATNDEIKSLNDEGIETQTIPWIKDKDN